MSLPLHVLSQLTASAHYLPAPISAHAVAAAELANIPNPAPASPGPGSGAVATLLAWVKWLALAACAASAAAAGGMVAARSVTRRSELAAPRQTSLLLAIVGAGGVAGPLPPTHPALPPSPPLSPPPPP